MYKYNLLQLCSRNNLNIAVGRLIIIGKGGTGPKLNV